MFISYVYQYAFECGRRQFYTNMAEALPAHDFLALSRPGVLFRLHRSRQLAQISKHRVPCMHRRRACISMHNIHFLPLKAAKHLPNWLALPAAQSRRSLIQCARPPRILGAPCTSVGEEHAGWQRGP